MPKDMQALMKQAQQMQQAQQQLTDQQFTGSAGGGVVKATVTGSGDLVSVEFDPSVLDPEDPEMAGDLVVAAFKQAMSQANEAAADAMGPLAGLDMGGLGGLLG
jgi:DNA-binding YbaB/EbfC family protein